MTVWSDASFYNLERGRRGRDRDRNGNWIYNYLYAISAYHQYGVDSRLAL